jgi:DNA ligase-1
MQELNVIAQFIEEMKSTSSTNDKKAIIQKYDSAFFRKILNYTYNPFKKYYVTSDNLKKRSDLCFNNYEGQLFQLLDDLNDRNITGNDAIACVNGFIAKNSDHAEIIYDVIDRNLKTRATTTLINTVLPDTIPTFDVALALPYDEKTKKKVNFEKDVWFMSRKLDGIRCISIFDMDGKVKFYSRAGNEFLTLSVLAADLEKLRLFNVVIDGEICLVDENGKEDFQGIIKQIGRKDHTIENPMYLMFDMLTLDDFLAGTSTESFGTRSGRLFWLAKDNTLKYAAHLEQFRVSGEADVVKSMVTVREQGWEGLMLRKDSVYIGKRSNEILKVKEMHDAEYTVLDVETAVQRVIVNGTEVEELMLKNAIIEHRGNRVQVGSGFSLEQRRFFRDNPHELIGKVITVQYFEESQDQHGAYSLRFPVFKTIYENGRTV